MNLGIKGICDKCKEKEGELVACPYSYEVYEMVRLQFYCEECYSEALWNI